MKLLFSTRYFFAAGVISVAAAVYFLPAEDKEEILTTVVYITDEGFAPEELKVEKGTRVVFKNNSQNLHWPASDFHPAHTLYPEEGGCIGSKFDACRGLENGEEFSFVMNIPGRWTVHDHLYPGLTMLIGVGEHNTSELSEDITPEELRQLGYADQLKIIKQIAAKEPLEAWDMMKRAFIVNGQVISNAHELAHIVGNELYEQEGLRGIKGCDDSFAFGCYHGVSEKLLQNEGHRIINKVQDECIRIFPPETSSNYTGCIHGMGHGLLSYRNFNLSAALKDCDVLNVSYRPYCYDGVFMENSFNISDSDIDLSDSWRLCSNLDQKYSYNCARYQSQMLLSKLKGDPVALGRECAKAPDENLKKPCSESIGFFVTQRSTGDADVIISKCGSLEDEGVRTYCFMGAAKEMVFQSYNNWQASSAKICNSLRGDDKDQCFDDVEDVKLRYNR